MANSKTGSNEFNQFPNQQNDEEVCLALSTHNSVFTKVKFPAGPWVFKAGVVTVVVVFKTFVPHSAHLASASATDFFRDHSNDCSTFAREIYTKAKTVK